MTPADWITATFTDLGPDDLPVIATYGDTVVECSPDTFGALAGAVSVPPTHTELSALPIAAQGWQQHFDQWLAKGLISQ